MTHNPFSAGRGEDPTRNSQSRETGSPLSGKPAEDMLIGVLAQLKKQQPEANQVPPVPVPEESIPDAATGWTPRTAENRTQQFPQDPAPWTPASRSTAPSGHSPRRERTFDTARIPEQHVNDAPVPTEEEDNVDTFLDDVQAAQNARYKEGFGRKLGRFGVRAVFVIAIADLGTGVYFGAEEARETQGPPKQKMSAFFSGAMEGVFDSYSGLIKIVNGK